MGQLGVLVTLLTFCLFANCYIPKISYKIRDFCIDDSGISSEMAEALLTHPHSDIIELEACYLQCVYRESGYLTEDGLVVHAKFEDLKNSDLQQLDLDCLWAVGKLETCTDMLKLVACHLL